jgi:hypothetical protein
LKPSSVCSLRSRENVRYAVFGGIALGLLGLPRATEAIDIFLPEDAANLERLKRALHSVFTDPLIDEISAEDLLGEYPAVRYLPDGHDFGIDLVMRLGDAFSFDDLEVETGDVDGTKVSVVSPRTLYDMKCDTVRSRDRIDAERLREHFGFGDDD